MGKKCSRQKKNRSNTIVLVYWYGTSIGNGTWVPLSDMCKHEPARTPHAGHPRGNNTIRVQAMMTGPRSRTLASLPERERVQKVQVAVHDYKHVRKCKDCLRTKMKIKHPYIYGHSGASSSSPDGLSNKKTAVHTLYASV